MANTWTKITARYRYAMVRNGKKPEKPQFFFGGCNFRKGNNLGFCAVSNSQCGGQGFDGDKKLTTRIRIQKCNHRSNLRVAEKLRACGVQLVNLSARTYSFPTVFPFN
jgi:hypothetical protein